MTRQAAWRRAAGFAIGLALSAAGALAQGTGEGNDGGDRETGGALPELTAPMELRPITGREGSGERDEAYRLLPEGTYLSERLVRLRSIGERATAAVFVPTIGEPRIRPMALLPCSNTQAMEQLAQTGERGGRPAEGEPALFEVSGQVFRSKGLNYFLPLVFRAAPGEADRVGEAAPLEPEAEPEPAPPLLNRTADEVAVEDLIRELEAATAASATGRAAEGGGPVTLEREGGVVTLRRCRLTRGPAGAFAVTFDSGVEDDLSSAPMGLMPCELSDEMERIASRRGEHVTMTVSGRVFLYGRENYLLPTMFSVNPSGERGLSSAQ